MDIDVEGNNVVLVVADTLTALHLPCYGYDRDTAPFLTELVEENLMVKNAYSNAPWTVPSHASLFSGKLPSEHGMNTGNMVFQSSSFVEQLDRKGYNTVGISANSLVSEDLNFDRGFNSFHEVFDFDTENTEDFWNTAKKSLRNPDMETFRKGLKFAFNKLRGSSNRGADSIERIVKGEINSDTQPNFLFINYTETHLPYNPPVEYAEKFTEQASDKISRNLRDHNNSDKPEIFYQGFPNCTDEELVDLYDASIRYLDHKLESLYEYLNEELDDLVFIVTSDHGENFGEHGAYFHQCGIWEKSIRIPMIVAGDGVPDREVERNFSWRNTKELVLNGELKTSETVYSEYAGWQEMTGLKESQLKGLKKKFTLNRSRSVVKGEKALVQNSHIEDFQFTSEGCYSEHEKCFEDQKELEKKLDLILGERPSK